MVELVGKIGSMAMVDEEYGNIDYNRFARIGRELKPGMVWVSSGATEIGRIDYINRTGRELEGADDDVKTDYAAQGQAILMRMYRDFVNSSYSVRQVLVEHQHFNDEAKRAHLKNLLLRAIEQNAVPIVNYNDAVSVEENRKMEISALRSNQSDVAELVDNDETAARIACLLNAKRLVILTGTDGIYADVSDPNSLIERIEGATAEEVVASIDESKKRCCGASRRWAAGASSKLEYIKQPVLCGTEVYIANAKYALADIIGGRVRCTVVRLIKG